MNQMAHDGDSTSGSIPSAAAEGNASDPAHSSDKFAQDAEYHMRSMLDEWKARLENKTTEVKALLDDEIGRMVRQVEALYPSRSLPGSPAANDNQANSRRKPARKMFVPRESLLTAMMVHENYRTIFNISVAVLILFGLNICVTDFYATGKLGDLTLLWYSFRGFGPFFQLWTRLYAASYAVLPIAHLSALCRAQAKGQQGPSDTSGTASLASPPRSGCRPPPSSWARAGRVGSLVLYLCLQYGFFSYSHWALTTHSFAPALAMALATEQTRFSMKMHAYFREKSLWLPMGNAYPPAAPVTQAYVSRELGSFTYFLWVPTLIYRTSYPRTIIIRWGFVAEKALEVVGLVYYAFVIFRMALDQFQGVPSVLQREREGGSKILVLSTFSCMGPGMALMFLGHFLVLHAWQNMFAEMTRFADRRFYADWWNARTWGHFYRDWNGVVHDFIHTYLFSDFIELLGTSRGIALILSFAISAISHEYILTLALGFFLPILTVLFGGPGVLFIMLTRRKTGRIWNIFMWLMLCLGNGVLMFLYAREYYARLHWQENGGSTSCSYQDPDRPWSWWWNSWQPYFWRQFVQDCGAQN